MTAVPGEALMTAVIGAELPIVLIGVTLTAAVPGAALMTAVIGAALPIVLTGAVLMAVVPGAALTAAVPAAALMTAVPGAALMTAVIGAALPTELTGPEVPAVTPWEPAPTDLETPGQQRAGHRKAARAFIPLRDIWAVPAGVPAQVPGRETTTAETVDREDGEALIPDRIIFTKKSFLRTTFCGTESETILMRLLRRKEPVRGKGSARNGKKSSGKCISGLEPARRLPWLRSSS